jgi:hypothetical protein
MPIGLGAEYTLTLNVLSGLTSFSMTESGTITDHLGNIDNFSTSR